MMSANSSSIKQNTNFSKKLLTPTLAFQISAGSQPIRKNGNLVAAGALTSFAGFGTYVAGKFMEFGYNDKTDRLHKRLGVDIAKMYDGYYYSKNVLSLDVLSDKNKKEITDTLQKAKEKNPWLTDSDERHLRVSYLQNQAKNPAQHFKPMIEFRKNQAQQALDMSTDKTVLNDYLKRKAFRFFNDTSDIHQSDRITRAFWDRNPERAYTQNYVITPVEDMSGKKQLTLSPLYDTSSSQAEKMNKFNVKPEPHKYLSDLPNPRRPHPALSDYGSKVVGLPYTKNEVLELDMLGKKILDKDITDWKQGSYDKKKVDIGFGERAEKLFFDKRDDAYSEGERFKKKLTTAENIKNDIKTNSWDDVTKFYESSLRQFSKSKGNATAALRGIESMEQEVVQLSKMAKRVKAVKIGGGVLMGLGVVAAGYGIYTDIKGVAANYNKEKGIGQNTKVALGNLGLTTLESVANFAPGIGGFAVGLGVSSASSNLKTKWRNYVLS